MAAQPGLGSPSLSAAGTASGYALEGPKWASSTVTWSFADSTDAQDAATPFSTPLGTAYQSTIEQAIARWASVSNLHFAQVSDGPLPGQAADIRIGFADLNTPATDTVGYTTYRDTSSSDGAMAFSPDVVVRLEDPGQDPLTQGPGSSLVYQGFATNLYQVALHEIGHALGLDHTADPNAVMAPTLGPSNLDLDATDIAGIQALYGAPSAPLPTAAAPDTLTVDLSEDAYRGDAQAIVTLDGKTLTPQPVSITARHATGATQALTFAGDFGAGPHQVGISFINDAWGGTASADRNLYVDAVTLDGQASPDVAAHSTAMWWNGTDRFSVTAPTPAPVQAPAPPADHTLVLHLSEDAWQGDARFVATLDGQALNGAQAVLASHAVGGEQAFTFHGSFGDGPHDLAVSFINDAWGGTASTDRNLYVDAVDYDGASLGNGTAALYRNSTVHFSLPGSGGAGQAPADSSAHSSNPADVVLKAA